MKPRLYIHSQIKSILAAAFLLADEQRIMSEVEAEEHLAHPTNGIRRGCVSEGVELNELYFTFDEEAVMDALWKELGIGLSGLDGDRASRSNHGRNLVVMERGHLCLRDDTVEQYKAFDELHKKLQEDFLPTPEPAELDVNDSLIQTVVDPRSSTIGGIGHSSAQYALAVSHALLASIRQCPRKERTRTWILVS